MPEKYRIKFELSDDATYLDALAQIVLINALEGKLDAVREIRESVERKARLRQEIINPEDREIRIRVFTDGALFTPEAEDAS